MSDTDVPPVALPVDPLPKRTPDRTFSLQRTFSSLRHRNFRLWFWGQMTSLFGSWMQTTAQGFLVYQLTHSPAYLGYVGFAAGLPSWGLMLYGGVVADRMSRRILLVVTQTIMLLQAVCLAVLAFTGTVQPWHVVALAFGLGIANAFDAPARQAFVSELVGPGDLTNAIALNSTMFNAATALGPALAGVTYAAFGAGWCFTVNAISFIAVIAALVSMRIPSHPSGHRKQAVTKELKEGVRYVIHHPLIRTLNVLVATTSMFAISLSTLVPAWAVNILHGDATTNGLLYSWRGVGALIAAIGIASFAHAVVRGRFVSGATIFLPIALIAFALIPIPGASYILIGVVGFFTILVNNLSNSLIQGSVPDQLRGRVMGVFTFIFFGGMPVGALLLGSLAEHLVEQLAVVLSAFCALTVALFVRYRIPMLRTVE